MKKMTPLNYIKDNIKDLETRLNYYQDRKTDLEGRIDSLDYEEEENDRDELMAIESSLQQQLADVSSSVFWIDDHINTLKKILDLL